MAYNKTEHLRRNIDAIRTAFALEREQRAATPEERNALRAYSGFGAIKEVLEPLPHKKKTALTPLIEELHALLKENTPDERTYKRYFDGIKSSVLTAFYTPRAVTDAIMKTIAAGAGDPVRILEPSAGIGAFIENIRRDNLFRERPRDRADLEKPLPGSRGAYRRVRTHRTGQERLL